MLEILHKALQDLGLNALESEVYVALQGKGPCTGYRIAKEVGKATANVYKAIDVLSRKGGVMLQEGGKNRLVLAVPPSEFLSNLRVEYQRKTEELNAIFETSQFESEDSNLYQLESVPLALGKAREMLGKAERVVVMDAFPKVVELFREDLAACAARGIDVFLQAYLPVEIEGVEVCHPMPSAAVQAHWQSQQLNLVVDARRSLVALFDEGMNRVHESVYSENLYLSCILHAGSFKENRLFVIENMVRNGASLNELQAFFDGLGLFHNSDIPGNKELLARFMSPEGRKLLNVNSNPKPN